jgi:NAD+ synthase
MQLILAELSLNYSRVEKEILAFIRKTVADSGAKGAIIGLSGGIDSSVVGALCVRALGKDKVIGVLMPAYHTPEQDVKDARAMAKNWGIKTYEVPIDKTFDALTESLSLNSENKIAQANSKARIRMTILYHYANAFGMLVAGTGDKSEDILGYFTKWGDGGVDFLPIAHLYKTQVRQLGAHLGLPQGVVTKPASPQLWPGHKATDELPLAYEQLDPVLYGLFEAKLSPKKVAKQTGVGTDIIDKVLRMNRTSAHKRAYPPMLGSW